MNPIKMQLCSVAECFLSVEQSRQQVEVMQELGLPWVIREEKHRDGDPRQYWYLHREASVEIEVSSIEQLKELGEKLKERLILDFENSCILILNDYLD